MNTANVAKVLFGAVTAITAVTLINKVLKETNFNEILKDITIDLDAFTPREEKVINPNGEDLTVKPEYVTIEDVPSENEHTLKTSQHHRTVT